MCYSYQDIHIDFCSSAIEFIIQLGMNKDLTLEGRWKVYGEFPLISCLLKKPDTQYKPSLM